MDGVLNDVDGVGGAGNKTRTGRTTPHKRHRVIDIHDETCLITVASKCNRLRTLEAAGMSVAVNDSLLSTLPELTPLLTILDLSRTNITGQKLSLAIVRLPLLSSLTISNCPRLFSTNQIQTNQINTVTKTRTVQVVTRDAFGFESTNEHEETFTEDIEIKVEDEQLLMLQLLKHKLLKTLNVSNNENLSDSVLLQSLRRYQVPSHQGNKEEENSMTSEPEHPDGEVVVDGDVVDGDVVDGPVADGAPEEINVGSPKGLLKKQRNQCCCSWTSLDISFDEHLTNVSLVPLFDRLVCLEKIKMLGVSRVQDELLLALHATKNGTLGTRKNGNNALRDGAMDSMKQMLHPLVALDVSGCTLLTGRGVEKVVLHCPTMQSLSLSGLHATKFSFATVLPLLLNRSHLQALDLSGNKSKKTFLWGPGVWCCFDCGGVIDLLLFDLMVVFLSGDCITFDYLAQLLSSSLSLQVLNINGCSAVKNRSQLEELQQLNGSVDVLWNPLTKPRRANRVFVPTVVEDGKKGKKGKKKKGKKKK